MRVPRAIGIVLSVLLLAPLALAFAACGGSDSETTGSTGTESAFSCPGGGQGKRALRQLWSDFDRRYAVFDVRLGDRSWAELGNEACAQLGDDASRAETFEALIDLLRTLDDGHTNLSAPDLGRHEDALVSNYPHEREIESVERVVERNYVDGSLTRAARGRFAWGRIGAFGYLSITSLDGLSPGGTEAGDRQAANAAMAAATADLAGARGIVVDIRANGGGWDSVALAVASWFAGERTLAWSEQRRDGPGHDDFGPAKDVFLADARPGAFDGPVALLTSGATFSAAETFALAMRVRDEVTLVGETSAGQFSDLIAGRLRNGWRYTLSGERYRAADGEIYEARGVPVDVEAGFDPSALAEGRDPMLETALTELVR